MHLPSATQHCCTLLSPATKFSLICMSSFPFGAPSHLLPSMYMRGWVLSVSVLYKCYLFVRCSSLSRTCSGILDITLHIGDFVADLLQLGNETVHRHHPRPRPGHIDVTTLLPHIPQGVICLHCVQVVAPVMAP